MSFLTSSRVRAVRSIVVIVACSAFRAALAGVVLGDVMVLRYEDIKRSGFKIPSTNQSAPTEIPPNVQTGKRDKISKTLHWPRQLRVRPKRSKIITAKRRQV
jgi:hypothetical protein